MESVKAAPELERKLVAIFAADVHGFTAQMEADEEATLSTLSNHRLLMDGLIAELGGRITGTAGDSVIAEFPSVIEAVNCAVKSQCAIADANEALEPDRRMQFRIGINVGDVMVKSTEIFGDGVNVAARLESLADPGGVCVSRGVREYVKKQTDYVFDDLGEKKVKNIEHTIRAYRIVFEDGVAAKGPSATGPAADATATPPVDPAVELAFWDTIKDSKDRKEFEAYLAKYPEGDFVKLATIRLTNLTNE